MGDLTYFRKMYEQRKSFISIIKQRLNCPHYKRPRRVSCKTHFIEFESVKLENEIAMLFCGLQ